MHMRKGKTQSKSAHNLHMYQKLQFLWFRHVIEEACLLLRRNDQGFSDSREARATHNLEIALLRHVWVYTYFAWLGLYTFILFYLCVKIPDCFSNKGTVCTLVTSEFVNDIGAKTVRHLVFIVKERESELFKGNVDNNNRLSNFENFSFYVV